MPRDSSTPLRSRFANDLSAVLLAGGESRRMGTDKATFLFRGKPLWQVQLETLRKLRPAEIFLSARTDPSWRPDDVQFIADVPPSCGPLSGLAASLVEDSHRPSSCARDRYALHDRKLPSARFAMRSSPAVVSSRRSTIVPSRWRPYIRAKQRLIFALRSQAPIFHCKTSFVTW